MGCELQDPCVRVGMDKDFGLDHFEKIKLVSDHANELGLSTTISEAAHIVGAAYAASQIEGGQPGVPVNICVKAGRSGDTEYSVLTTNGKILVEWTSTVITGTP